MNVAAANILLAIDGSQHSQAAVELVRDLPLPPNTSLTLLSVVYRRDASAQIQPVLEKVVAQAQTRLEGKGLDLAAEIAEGHPADVITRSAEEHGCALIVIGAVGLRATLGIMLGGVAQQVVEHASCPVLVVRAPYSGLKRALVVTDGSSCSQLAVSYLNRFPLPAATRVEAMHVLAPPITLDRIAAAWPVGAGMLIYPTDEDMVVQMAEWQMREEQTGREISGQCGCRSGAHRTLGERSNAARRCRD